jgi:hypothetical protein
MNQIARIRTLLREIHAEIQDLRKRSEPFSTAEMDALEAVGLELTAHSMRLFCLVERSVDGKVPLALEES